MVFSTNDAYFIKVVCDIIWQYNLDLGNEVFMVFFPKIMDKVSAAIKIQ
jgi:hypothetical protein